MSCFTSCPRFKCTRPPCNTSKQSCPAAANQRRAKMLLLTSQKPCPPPLPFPTTNGAKTGAAAQHIALPLSHPPPPTATTPPLHQQMEAVCCSVLPNRVSRGQPSALRRGWLHSARRWACRSSIPLQLLPKTSSKKRVCRSYLSQRDALYHAAADSRSSCVHPPCTGRSGGVGLCSHWQRQDRGFCSAYAAAAVLRPVSGCAGSCPHASAYLIIRQVRRIRSRAHPHSRACVSNRGAVQRAGQQVLIVHCCPSSLL
jgi:hypothetical protein